MPKQYADSVQAAFWLKPVLASMLSHTISWLDVAADDPDIVILCKDYELARTRLSTLAGINPQAAVAYQTFRFLHQMEEMGTSNMHLVPEVVLHQRLNPQDKTLPFKFRYSTPFLRRNRIDKVLNVYAITPYDGAERPTVEVHIG